MEGITILEENIIHSPNLISIYLFISGIIVLIVDIALITAFDIEEISLNLFIIGMLTLFTGFITSATIPGPPTNQARYIIRIEKK